MNAQDLAKTVLNTPVITDSATLQKALQGVMDYFAASLQASNQADLQSFKSWIAKEGGNPTAWLIGQKCLATARQAALFNGFQAHYLDYDDVHAAVRGHPSAVILSALFASIDMSHPQYVNGQRFLTAYVIGVEVMARLGKQLNPSHYLKGWHSTATMGAIAATCAVSYLHQKGSLAQSIALAATQSSGMRFVFGSPVKPLHAGLAAQNAVQSIEWIQAGLSLLQNPFDETIGFFSLLGAEKITENWLSHWGDEWQIHQLWFKTYLYCSAAAGVADLAYELKNQLVNIDNIKHIELIFHPKADAALIYREVVFPAQGKFSAEYIVASILLGQSLDFRHFEQSVCDPKIRQLMAKIDRLYQTHDENTRKVEVRIHLKNGETRQAISDYPNGSPMKPYSDTELQQKLAAAIDNKSLYQTFYTDLISLKTGHNLWDFIQQHHLTL